MKMIELRELIRLIDESDITELEIEDEGVQILLKKPEVEMIVQQEVAAPFPVQAGVAEQASPAAVANEDVQEVAVSEPAAPAANQEEIKSDWVGVFSATPKPGAAPYVKVGDRVEKGQVVCRCYVDILKLSHDIYSTVSGEVVDILAEEGHLIEYGQPLFTVKVD